MLVSCETNHALDQFGEHIVEAGIDNVVRVGSRSKSKLLEPKYNLNHMRRTGTTKAEKNARGLLSAQVKGTLSLARKCLGPIHQAMARRPSWPLLKSFLSTRYPRVYNQFRPDDAEGFTLVGDPILNWLGPRPSRIDDVPYPRLIGKASTNIASLTVNEKWALVSAWLDKLVQDQTQSMMGHLQKAQNLRQNLARLNQDINCRLLRNADIVLMTTSRLAHDNEMLRKLKPKVIICEEAAEVMEPRMMAVFIPGVEHLIQIGDHQQLRPLVQNSMQFSMETKVGKHYQLDRSLFERRVTGEPGMEPLPVIQLNEQQRMPPEISALIRNNVYKDLQDGSRVKNRPMVVGLRERLYWWDHDQEEGMGMNAAQSMSYTNSKEVAMATALVLHLVRQGVYEGKDIAILTPYAGQLLELQAALDKHFEVVLSERDEERLGAQGFDKKSKAGDAEKPIQTLLPSGKIQMADGIRLATVDGFQGEQAKVIIISLVRSNKHSKVGFLKLKNRINVLLSRVQEGMYLIGNAATFPAVDMWKDVYRQISARKAAGPSIPLCCPRHPKSAIYCTSPEDFASVSPEGGCALDCGKNLPICGHPCPNNCHSKMLHKAVTCPKPCPRVRKTCKHACPKLCGQECGKCMEVVSDVQLPCGHTKHKLLCHQLLDLESVLCRAKVNKQVPACGHTVSVDCSTDVSSDRFLCEGRCDALLPCKHKCQGTCWLCRRSDGEGGGVIIQHKACGTCKPETWGLSDIERKLAIIDGELRQSSNTVDADTAKQLLLGKKFSWEDNGSPLPDRYESCQKLLELCQGVQEDIMHDGMKRLNLDEQDSQPHPQPDDVPKSPPLSLTALLIEHKVKETILRDKFRLLANLDDESMYDKTTWDPVERSVHSFTQTSMSLLEYCSKAKVPRFTCILMILHARVCLLSLVYQQPLLVDNTDSGTAASGARADGSSQNEATAATERFEGVFDLFAKAQFYCDESSKEDADLRRCLNEVLPFKKKPVEKLTLKGAVEAMGEVPVVLVPKSG